MSRILVKGIVRNGRVEVEQPINLPDGSEVTIIGHVQTHAGWSEPLPRALRTSGKLK